MKWSLYRLLLFPEGAEGSGSTPPAEGDGSGDNPPAEGDNPPAEGDGSGDPPAPPPKPKADKSKKIQVSQDRLNALEERDRKLAERERADQEAADAREKARLKQQQEKDPAAALVTLQRKYTTDTQRLTRENEALKSELETLRGELAADEMERQIKTGLNDALSAARLEIANEKLALPRMVGEIADRLNIERQADGSYEIFGKDDGSDMQAIIKDMVVNEFKELYLKPRRSDPANAGDSRRRPPEGDGGGGGGGGGEQPTWRQAFADRKKLYNNANGVIPAVGLKPPASKK